MFVTVFKFQYSKLDWFVFSRIGVMILNMCVILTVNLSITTSLATIWIHNMCYSNAFTTMKIFIYYWPLNCSLKESDP
jgi:hypothetical protein